VELTKEQIKFFGDYDIIGASDMSDIIISCGKNNDALYKNITSGLESSSFKDVLRRGRKYIYLGGSDVLGNPPCRGFLAKYLEKEGVLLSSFYVLSYEELKWKETLRVVFWKDSYLYLSVNGGSCRVNAAFLAEYHAATDLGGQFIYKEPENPSGVNISRYSFDEINRFTGGGFYDKCTHFSYITGCRLFQLAHKLFTRDLSFGLGIEKNYMGNIIVEEKPLPDDVMGIIGESAASLYENNKFSNWKCFVNGFFFGYLQKENGFYVYRVFRAVIYGMPRRGRLPIKYIETRRVMLSPECLKNMRDVSAPILCYDKDGIEDGPFKYAAKYIKDGVMDNRECLLNNGWEEFTDYIMGAACCIAFSPVYEKILNFFMDDERDDPRYIELLGISLSGGDMMHRLQWYVGELYTDEKQVHKIMGVSKSVLDVFKADRYCDFFVLQVLKYMFDDEKEYLMRMDKGTAKSFLDGIVLYGLYVDGLLTKCIRILIRMYGVNNSIRYLDFLGREYEYSCQEYYRYIQKIEEIWKYTDLTLRWKVKQKDLEKEEKSINEAYRLIHDEMFYKDASESFIAQYENWRQYEYTDGKFLVTYPKGPTDLIEEGFKLNHCAGEFIDNVSSRISTILFIRKKDEPDVPFFTLELRGNTARQCHGFNNCNICDCDGMAEFIHNFCGEKKIMISSGINDMLGNE